MAAFARIGVVDPYELERLAEELAGPKGRRIDTSYSLPTVLEPRSHEHPLLRAENPSFDVEEFDISFTYVLARPARWTQGLSCTSQSRIGATHQRRL